MGIKRGDYERTGITGSRSSGTKVSVTNLNSVQPGLAALASGVYSLAKANNVLANGLDSWAKFFDNIGNKCVTAKGRLDANKLNTQAAVDNLKALNDIGINENSTGEDKEMFDRAKARVLEMRRVETQQDFFNFGQFGTSMFGFEDYGSKEDVDWLKERNRSLKK